MIRWPTNAPDWTRHFVYRTQQTRTTWKLRAGVAFVVMMAAWLTRGWWTVAVAQSLVCRQNVAASDAILVENFDLNYLVFERASRLRQQGLAARVIVPVPMDRDTGEPNAVALGTTEVIATIARLGPMDVVPTREIEPISLNQAEDLLHFVQREHIRSVIVVSPLFRSRRSALVYDAILGRAGVIVRCVPADETRDVRTWTTTWHGLQDVGEQWIKLQYYRFYVLPFEARRDSA